MRTPITAMALLLAAGVANAAPIYLSCDGKTTAIMEGQRDRVFQEVRTVTIDLSARTVTFQGYGPMLIVKVDEERIGFITEVPNLGVLVGMISRITSALLVMVRLTDGQYKDIFEGVCKPATKLG